MHTAEASTSSRLHFMSLASAKLNALRAIVCIEYLPFAAFKIITRSPVTYLARTRTITVNQSLRPLSNTRGSHAI